MIWLPVAIRLKFINLKIQNHKQYDEIVTHKNGTNKRWNKWLNQMIWQKKL